MSTADASRAALRADGETILRKAIRAVLPDGAVRRALAGVQFPGRVFLVAAGKAAWQMASVAREVLPTLAGGVVVTKYGHPYNLSMAEQSHSKRRTFLHRAVPVIDVHAVSQPMVR